MENLKELNLLEITRDEAISTNGGVAPWVWPIGVYLFTEVMNNWGDIRDGWQDGGSGNSRY